MDAKRLTESIAHPIARSAPITRPILAGPKGGDDGDISAKHLTSTTHVCINPYGEGYYIVCKADRNRNLITGQ